MRRRRDQATDFVLAAQHSRLLLPAYFLSVIDTAVSSNHHAFHTMPTVRRVVTRHFLGVDYCGALVALPAGVMLSVVSDPEPDGFVQVVCAENGKHVRVLAADLSTRSQVVPDACSECNSGGVPTH